MASASDAEARFWAAAERGTSFFMGNADVQRALVALAQRLEDLSVPYAIAGAMALNAYGYERFTSDVDVLLTSDGLAAFKAAWLGRGYEERYPGSREIHDNEHDVAIDVLIAGAFPGDGKPKPVRFPDPDESWVERHVRLLPVEKLVELKLASGLSAPHRLRDLADVLELIRHASLPRDLGDALDPSVRPKYAELWQAAQTVDPE